MLIKNRLFTPGPTPLLPSAQFAMAAADIHHRTAEFRALYSKVLADLQTFIGTRNDVILMASSGTGAMEAAVANLTSPGDKVLILSAGKFGERWIALAKAYGLSATVVKAEYGQTFAMEEVKPHLTADVRVVFMQASESSTGARHDVAAVAHAISAAGHDTLLAVDAITGLGTMAFDVDGDRIDIIIGGSQKALMAPPGLAYLSVSERAWKRMETAKSTRFYFDLRTERKAAAKGESAWTPATAMVAALNAALDYLRQAGDGDLAAGRDRLIANAQLCAAMTRAAAAACGLKLFAAASPTAALTAIMPPDGVDAGVLVKAFKKRFGAVVANGQGEMTGHLFRIAHLGYFDYMDTIAIIGAMEQVLASVLPAGSIQFGAALFAAQKVFAAAQSGTHSGNQAASTPAHPELAQSGLAGGELVSATSGKS